MEYVAQHGRCVLCGVADDPMRGVSQRCRKRGVAQRGQRACDFRDGAFQWLVKRRLEKRPIFDPVYRRQWIDARINGGLFNQSGGDVGAPRKVRYTGLPVAEPLWLWPCIVRADHGAARSHRNPLTALLVTPGRCRRPKQLTLWCNAPYVFNVLHTVHHAHNDGIGCQSVSHSVQCVAGSPAFSGDE